jgi:hypothetical protein
VNKAALSIRIGYAWHMSERALGIIARYARTCAAIRRKHRGMELHARHRKRRATSILDKRFDKFMKNRRETLRLCYNGGEAIRFGKEVAQ